MEANKENVNRLKTITRIPVPLEPLPALPKHLLAKTKDAHTKVTNERYPLKTLNAQASLVLPGTSKQKSTLNAKHVTVRKKVELLDWNYKVFKDERANEDQVITISDDEDTKMEEFEFFIENNPKNCLGATTSAETPAVKASLEPSRVRNIKRSLKRPHSRELQGISPLGKEAKIGEEKVKRKLQFNEPIQDRLKSPDFLKTLYMTCVCRDYSEELFNHLLAMEQKPLRPRISSILRSCVMNWLVKVNGADGNPAIIQTAAWYFDAVLQNIDINLDNLQLTAAGCYWIAHKLHGPLISATRLTKCSDDAFSTKKLMAVEKLILQKLKFPPQPVVPQDFITYLSWWCDNEHPGEIEVAATFICMSGLLVDRTVCTEYPSVISAAAVRNALLLLGKRSLMLRLQMCPVFRSAEKKVTNNISYMCSVLRRSVRTLATPTYEYKALLEHYGTSPHYIAQRVINAARELNVIDTRIISKNECY